MHNDCQSELIYSSPLLSLIALKNQELINIKLKLNVPVLNTAFLPTTLTILENEIPRVLETKCFNKNGLSFKDEVIKTEIGHLFEHILLEYLCRLKLSTGLKEASFKGRTLWNWKINPRGLFNILIYGQIDKKMLQHALAETIFLTELILTSSSVINPKNNKHIPLELQLKE